MKDGVDKIMSKNVTFALIGAGSRGLVCFGKYILQIAIYYNCYLYAF
jgi:hypothetical protein